jgi:CheY-like chemotaxis protein
VKTRKHTLLIVDDDDTQRFFLEKTFKNLGAKYRVKCARSGTEALAYLKGEGKYADRSEFEFPSYIITDLNMSPGDGFMLLDFLKQNPALSVTPVVMLSSSEDPDDIRQAYLLGASSYFVKPAGLRALKELVKKIHDYWAECEVPEVDAEGYAVPTESHGRPGARFPKPRR